MRAIMRQHFCATIYGARPLIARIYGAHSYPWLYLRQYYCFIIQAHIYCFTT